MSLVEKLVELQRGHNWTNTQMAAYLGVHRVVWVNVRLGWRKPSRNLLARVAELCPEWLIDIINEL